MIDGPLTSIVVRHRVAGFHRWPQASGKREYLAERHRHLFHVEVEVEVGHDNREVEFHDLLDHVHQFFIDNGPEWGIASCETIAFQLASRIRANISMRPEGMVDALPWNRTMTVSIFEDGECGARVHWDRKDDHVSNQQAV